MAGRPAGFTAGRALAPYGVRHGDAQGGPLGVVHGKFDKQIIMNTRGYAFNMDRQKTLLEKIDYGNKNPIRRGLVDRPGDWPWSSYRYYELDDSSVLKMDWDGVWTIVW